MILFLILLMNLVASNYGSYRVPIECFLIQTKANLEFSVQILYLSMHVKSVHSASVHGLFFEYLSA